MAVRNLFLLNTRDASLQLNLALDFIQVALFSVRPLC